AANRTAASLAGLRRSRGVMDAPLRDPELKDREYEDGEEEDVRDRSAVAGIEELERLLEEVIDDDRGRVERAAASRDVDLVEELQRVDRGPDDEEDRRRTEQRPDDAPERRELSGTVDRRRLDQLLRNALQRSEVHDRVEPDPAPGRHRDHRGERLVRILEE